MTKKKTCVEKFQYMWNKLDEEEKRDLYELLSAVRGPDFDDDDLKMITTAKIRVFLFGSQEALKYTGSLNNSDPILESDIKQCPTVSDKQHFGNHVARAYDVINKLQGFPKLKDTYDDIWYHIS